MNDLDLAIALARDGGAIVAEAFGRHRTTDYKGRNDPVTEVDRAAEVAITSMLTAERPGDGIIGEEGANRRGGDRTWLIDPLDGTVNFVHGLPIVSVSIGLYENDSPLVGVVYDPINEELYAAATGQGATLNDRPIQVSDIGDLGKSLVVTGFPYDHHDHAEAYLRPLGEMLRTVNGIRRLGSAALDLCYIAAGRIDAGWEFNLNPWDVAAGLAVLIEAGGKATNPAGDPMTPYRRHLVSSNGLLHEGIRQIVDTTMPEHLKPHQA